MLTLAGTKQHSTQDNKTKCFVVIVKCIRDPMEPKCDQSPTKSGWKYDPLGSKSIAEISAQYLGERVTPEEWRQHRSNLGLGPFEILSHGRGCEGHGGTTCISGHCTQQQGEKPKIFFSPSKNYICITYWHLIISPNLGSTSYYMLLKQIVFDYAKKTLDI